MFYLAGQPCSQLVRETFDAHVRRRILVLDIWLLSDHRTTFLALWLARGAAIRGGTIDGALRRFRAALLV